MSWPTYALDELGMVSRGRSRHRPRDAEHLYGGPFPFIQTGDVKAAPMYLKSFSQTYSEAGLAQSRMWPRGTLCITIAANIAETCILDIDACFPDSIIGFVADPGMANTKFVKYQFDAIMREQMRRVSQGAAQDNLSQAKLLSFRFPMPDLPTQERIAGVLSTYDDLIENNRRRIALLEQAARLLYGEWFVHFRFPGYETAKFVDGLPEGWRKCSVDQLLVLQRGFDLPISKRKEGSVPIYGSTGIVGYHNQPKVVAPVITTGRSGSLGQVSYSHDDCWPLNTALWVKELKDIPPLYAFFFLQNLDLKKFGGGASVPTLDRKVIHRLDAVLPAPKILEQFEIAVGPMFQQVKNFEVQNDKLTKVRDLLLPRLMDGRLPIPE
ncbi:restriction endonuclease subunit S [Nitratireductor aquimarinus]|uniref:restriction endonuclease subunit S n=1 Tax=Nitratireductor aquimarinus TaxID=889300 RepID=UPI001A8C8E0E|nr:restriction endonuclease subunit S [Nitratireductor aquimarinus]MBN8242367.1 restriction endonuclease subunit S [Nitratireductor aquimarinus]MBY6130754.1 restriction endonuclease subunit S [Nitratireductor aquimarinus]MCA1302490.1 restriction endonuclease subunit S [Nitratireductor aquimarinus]